MPRRTIIVIDDDKHLVSLLKDYLEGAGFLVYTGYDGQMALPLARSHEADLIILDVDMPVTSGLKALSFLRADDDTKTIPVILLTGVASGSVFPAIEGLPRVSHLKKPV